MAGVFANVQTANVILFALNMSHGKLTSALAHVWPILAFFAGVGLASYLKSGRVERYLAHPMRWTMLLQAVVLFIIGFVPATVAHSYVTVPISFVAAMQMGGLFRNIGGFRVPAGGHHREPDAAGRSGLHRFRGP